MRPILQRREEPVGGTKNKDSVRSNLTRPGGRICRFCPYHASIAMKPPATFPLVQDPVGYVYLISSIGFFKIGFRRDLEKLLHDLRTGLPCAVELHSWIESEIPLLREGNSPSSPRRE